VLKTPKFNISAISVSGNSKINIDQIINDSGIKLGDNVIKGFLDVNKEKIKEIPYIADVKVSIKFPSELRIKVSERQSVYYAYDKEKNVYYRLDEYGTILELCDKIELKQQELLVSGITFDTEVKLGTKINDIDYSKLLVYENIEEQFYKTFPEQHITKVSFENSLTKIYINDKIEVILPNDTNLQYNLTFLKEILNKVVDAKGTIDMTKDNPTFINF
jgi:cell division septal protein FtsQ